MPELSRRIRQIVDGGDDGWSLHYRASRLRAAGEAVTMLSVGDHDFPTAPEILTAMHEGAQRGNLGYTPMAGLKSLRAAIAHRVCARNTVPAGPEHVIVATGGQGAIFSAMMAALDPGDACIVLDPYYASFKTTVRAVSATPIVVPTRADLGFQPDPEAIRAALTPKTRAILINTPNNPTGAVYTRERLEAIAAICRERDLWMISDELYDSQVHEGAHLSPRDLPGMAERTIQIGSLSKGYAMTGSRIGWAVAPVDAVERMTDLAGATTYGLPGYIQDAAIHALTHCAHQEAEIAALYLRRRDLALGALCNASSLAVAPPEGGMYIMLDVRGTGLSGIAFGEQLLDEERIAVMPGESFGHAAAGHVRIALTVPDAELGAAMDRIASFADRVASPQRRAMRGRKRSTVTQVR